MNRRCSDRTRKTWPDYGGRGITVCPEWRESFEAFFLDVGRRPGPAYSIDRINNDGHYRPGNVRWATQKEQQRNRRSARLITIGTETKSLVEWAEFSGIPKGVIHKRWKRGCPAESLLKGGT